ncbi:LANO_0C08988g1_1 [Lachancea nothofagi CBS 11611]|uniref:LANO_0C08988g1_1 n=1 Tax=Lachancea nothofagi CBS 11611 TaxID=1266666 RepID=A0A1G4J9P9_9SACH|nr:LANO_0C08988g1_1 [Lachancea nothofagi CBS 11611]
MQSSTLIARANNASAHTFANSNRKFWKFDWYTPLKPKQNTTASTDKTDKNDNAGEELYNFKYKTWLPSDQQAWQILDNDSDEIIDLSSYDRTRQVVQPQGSAPPNGAQKPTEGLSADDIRGAVGGQESLPGFSAPHASELEKKDSESNPDQPQPQDHTIDQEKMLGQEKAVDQEKIVDQEETVGQELPAIVDEKQSEDADGDIDLASS